MKKVKFYLNWCGVLKENDPDIELVEGILRQITPKQVKIDYRGNTHSFNVETGESIRSFNTGSIEPESLKSIQEILKSNPRGYKQEGWSDLEYKNTYSDPERFKLDPFYPKNEDFICKLPTDLQKFYTSEHVQEVYSAVIKVLEECKEYYCVNKVVKLSKVYEEIDSIFAECFGESDDNEIADDILPYGPTYLHDSIIGFIKYKFKEGNGGRYFWSDLYEHLKVPFEKVKPNAFL